MRLFDERKILRFLLIFASLFFAAFIPEMLLDKEDSLWAVPYIFADIFLILVAVLYRFPIAGNRKRIREDVMMTPPKTGAMPIRDFKKELSEKDELFQMMVDISSSGFWTFDVVTGKVYWSQKAVKLLQANLIEADDTFEILRGRLVESAWNNFKNCLKDALQTGEKFNVEVTLSKAASKNTRLLISGHVQMNEDGRPVRIIGALNEDAEKNTQERQNYYVYQDALTGVYNRKFFLEKLKVDVDLSLQRPDYKFAVALLDIDRFGAINTSYSTNVGDNVLKIVAGRIKSQCRPEDSTARIGPDVFAIVFHNVLMDCKDDDVKSIVRRIHNAVKLPIQLDGRELYIGVTMAVAMNNDVDCVEDILANATASLREMKKGPYHGGIQLFNGGIREKAMRLYELEFEIRKAIQAKEFVLLYQPIVDIADDNRVVGFEALVRWNQSERGFVSPAEFIPIAEETGLIIPMGALILRMACMQAKKWVDMGFDDFQIAVNFSAKQFAMDNMLDDLKMVLQETQLNPRNLKLEITEYTAMCEAEKTVEIMKAISEMGIQISIDDFGTGYSSLSYLKMFPIHTLKMDKSFIDHVAEDEEDAAFARMVIGLAKSLNLDLIAEGVETELQLNFLKREGCRLIQGFYFSKPLIPEVALEYLKAHYNPKIRVLPQEYA